jgi:hypothetical protein
MSKIQPLKAGCRLTYQIFLFLKRSIDELKALIRETVAEALEELLPDPDEGLTVKEEFKQELLEIRKLRESGFRGISMHNYLVESAELYARFYEVDSEIRGLAETALFEWPE